MPNPAMGSVPFAIMSQETQADTPRPHKTLVAKIATTHAGIGLSRVPEKRATAQLKTMGPTSRSRREVVAEYADSSNRDSLQLPMHRMFA